MPSHGLSIIPEFQEILGKTTLPRVFLCNFFDKNEKLMGITLIPIYLNLRKLTQQWCLAPKLGKTTHKADGIKYRTAKKRYDKNECTKRGTPPPPEQSSLHKGFRRC